MKAELKKGSVNQVAKGMDIYENGDMLDTIAIVVRGRVAVHGYGLNIAVGTGSFLGLRDLTRGAHGITYTALTNTTLFVFPVSGMMTDIKKIMRVKNEYGALMVSGMIKTLVQQEKLYEAFQDMAEAAYRFVNQKYQECQAIARESGVAFEEIPAVESLYPFDEPQMLAIDKIHYYQESEKIPMEVQKAFYGASEDICSYHIREITGLIHHQYSYCRSLTSYLEQLVKLLVQDQRSFFRTLMDFIASMQRANINTAKAMGCLDEVIAQIDRLEKVLTEQADVKPAINRSVLEEQYIALVNPGAAARRAEELSALSLDDRIAKEAEQLQDSLPKLLSYADMTEESSQRLIKLVRAFEGLPDKESTEDDARSLRRELMKEYYPLYLQVFLKNLEQEDHTPIYVDLFLRYGFLSEKLLREDLIYDLLTVRHNFASVEKNDSTGCRVFDLKEWLYAVATGEREPSKSEFDMDYEETLRDRKKNKEITEREHQELQRDGLKKLEFEIQNMFRINHRLCSGQISTFVPFLYTEGCLISFGKGYLSKDRIRAAFNRLRQIDFSAFYREMLYEGTLPGNGREFIQVEVCPDVILMPTIGTRDVMWQELSGRKRNTPGRLLLPIFFQGDLDKSVAHLTGGFRWELCRTMQGIYWNNIQYKSLTSEYSDFLQFYRKNKELSAERKDKVKMLIQKHRNNSREIFSSDYMSWVQHESSGSMLLNKPVREILATYCPFTEELRKNLSGQPIFQNAMARYNRERGKKRHEYDIKFRMWQNARIEIPPAVIVTRDFYMQ